MKIIRSKGGTEEREIELDSIQIPDLWHLAMSLTESGETRLSEMVLDTWHLAHDLISNLRELDLAGKKAPPAPPVVSKEGKVEMPGLTPEETQRLIRYLGLVVKALSDTERAEYQDLLGRQLDEVEEV